ncbi:MAG: class I SAM-dependent methyltransferase [Dehalococcoidia bacterium]
MRQPRLYQDLWVRGKATKAGRRDCASRYGPIFARLDGMDAPRVLDLGANAGYFGLRVAHDFPEASVLLADDYPLLKVMVQSNALPNTQCMAQRLPPARVRDLGPFDLVIAYSVLHHCPDPIGMLDSILGATRHALIELPAPEEYAGHRLTSAVAALWSEVRRHGLPTVYAGPFRRNGSGPVRSILHYVCAHPR